MKKLMVIAAVVFAAVAANAATVNWKITAANIKNYSGTAYNGAVAIWASGGDLDSDTEVASVNTTGSLSVAPFTTDDLTAGVKYNFYFMLTDNVDGTEYTYTSKTLTSKVAAETGATTLGFGNVADSTGTKSNWVAAPEPTSAMLLLLGMAGLALKRKQK